MADAAFRATRSPTARAPSGLLYKKSRFALVAQRRAGSILMRNTNPGKYAVWGELVDRRTGKRMFFVSAHTSPAFADYPARKREIQTLMSQDQQDQHRRACGHLCR